ncbi:MAG: hypothetical protein WCT02_04290 [Candidatus Paceibacterota bacterium]
MITKPFYNATFAAFYIVLIVNLVNLFTNSNVPEPSLIIPMTMLGLFVLSAAIMGYFFLAQPLQLLMDNQKTQAATFFLKTIGYFACFAALFVIALFLTGLK